MSFKPGQRVKYIGNKSQYIKKGAIATVIKSPGLPLLPENQWPTHTRGKRGGAFQTGVFTDEWLYIIWDESNPNWEGMGHGGFYPNNFEPVDNDKVLLSANNGKRCVCGGPAKKVPCGIGPAAQVIEICSVCGEEK